MHLNDEVDAIYIVQKGMIEYNTQFDDLAERPFCIERLFRGSVMNYRSFFSDTAVSACTVSFRGPTILQKLTYSTMKDLCTRHT